MHEIDKYIVSIPNFPAPGVVFRDVTSVVRDPDGLKLAIDELAALLEGVEFDAIAGPEARGFIFGMPLAYKLGKSFIPIRKKGRLPRETVSATYDLEYGSATIEVHKDDVKPGTKIVIVDDLIATGGSLEASAHLLESLKGEISKIVCLIELKGFNGRAKLKKYAFDSVIAYDGK